MFIYFEEVCKIERDAKIIMDWRNDNETLKMSYHSTPKEFSSFYKEYCQDYFNEIDLIPVFANYKGERVGFVRFKKYLDKEISGKAADISINIRPDKRRLGLGTEIIKKSCEHLFNRGFDTTVAEIRQNNISSIRAFEKAGFVYIGQEIKKIEDIDEEIPIFKYYRKKHINLNKSQNKVYIIAEAGSNWRSGTGQRDLKMAKALIDAAVDAGADAVKFQTYKGDTVYVSNAGDCDYLSESGISNSINEIFDDLSMPYEMIPKLAEYCKNNNIHFMSTPFSVADAEAVDPYVERHKLASYEITHSRLIEFMAKTNKPLFLSTGCATIEDIEWAVYYYYKNGGRDITLMQCTAKYPAPISSLNLNVIPQLQRHFNVPVGLSDHSRDPMIGPMGAVALGVSVIEKHFTLNNKLPGPDHSFAITPDELKLMVKTIRNMEQALGNNEKKINEEEFELYDFAQRAIQAVKHINIGELLIEGDNIDILRSGKQKRGIHPKWLDEIEGKSAKRDISIGDGIEIGDW
ncbi:MAG: GNAT family N-acetyltransferase [Nitrospirae bacterium]|nr:GNAT family N-acetyltransferase [Nitrospirota bacterium]